MQIYINTYQYSRNQLHFFKLFSYSSRGIPGLEIVGLGGQGRILKEKIIYLSKIRNLKIPNRKFVVCLDQMNIQNLLLRESFYFELPIAILFWSMAGVIKIRNLENLYASGFFDTNGSIKILYKEDLNYKIGNEQSVVLDKEVLGTNEGAFLRTVSPYMFLT